MCLLNKFIPMNVVKILVFTIASLTRHFAKIMIVKTIQFQVTRTHLSKVKYCACNLPSVLLLVLHSLVISVN